MVNDHNCIIIYDDREILNSDIKAYVGTEHYGDIVYRGHSLSQKFQSIIPSVNLQNFYHLKDDASLLLLKSDLSTNANRLNASVFIILSKAVTDEFNHLKSLIDRLQFAREDFVDRPKKPLITFFSSINTLFSRWHLFENNQNLLSDSLLDEMRKIKSINLLDLSKINDFLSFARTSSQSRHFNNLGFDNFYYTKSSSDHSKIYSEYTFYNLAPEHLRPWLVQPFDFKKEKSKSSYRMIRYYVPDLSFQWINNAFTENNFEEFINRIIFFINKRASKNCSMLDSEILINNIFIKKTEKRINQFLTMNEGKAVNDLLKNANGIGLEEIYNQYTSIFLEFKKKFMTKNLVIGHGDLCFSNILYEKNIFLLKFIDPRGAETENQLWDHPIYDLAKLSHSILGDYDFINNSLIRADFSEDGLFKLSHYEKKSDNLKILFTNKISQMGIDLKIIRIAEASLFLSMLPIHIDYPNKTLAFILRAKEILDEVQF
ncbi:hypothetical protein FIT69_04225 [Candidatus Methylopumilus planktonicus]|uniref:hypothetical protein n=1 Tax=Candidatus Methylopumilus planktonicus TaxID=1581557 RepID=UPI001120344E|nr:hypothetical protein [Candidatus Methylopumilus planktonicus]QDD01779.1 hypothetical protein FIT69_04225 [Candidatus Methylopumilus planktonicus]